MNDAVANTTADAVPGTPSSSPVAPLLCCCSVDADDDDAAACGSTMLLLVKSNDTLISSAKEESTGCSVRREKGGLHEFVVVFYQAGLRLGLPTIADFSFLHFLSAILRVQR